MSNVDNEELLIFNNGPLPASRSTVTLSILSEENDQDEQRGATKGLISPQDSLTEGLVTFNPRGDYIFFIPPLESTVSEPLLLPDTSKWDLYLVSLPFTLHPAPANRYYEKLKFSFKLSTPGAVAFDLFPDTITAEVEETKTYALSTQIKFKEVGVSLGQIGRKLQFKGLRPTVTAFGKGESSFYWIYQGYKEQRAVTPETKQALMVLQVPRGTSVVEGVISCEAVIVKQIFGEWKKKDGFAQDYPISWELRNAPPFVKVNASRNSEISTVRTLSYFDVCIFCALAEEAEYCMKEIERQCSVSFQSAFSANTGTYYHTIVRNNQSEALTVHISWQSKPGPVEAGLHIRPVLEECKPRFAAMTGICAGDRKKVKLGDLVVAESAFNYDAGKIVIDAWGQTKLLHDMDAWHPHPDVLHFARLFQQWKSAVENLEGLYSSTRVQPKVYIAPIASGSAVRGDNPFDQIRVLARNTIAVDMEAATFYRTVAQFPGVRSLLVKGISDYADGEKDDTYHTYASAASAAYILSFMREYVTSDRLSGLPSV